LDAILDLPRQEARGVSASALHTVFAKELSARDTLDFESFVAKARTSHYSQTPAWAPIAAASKPVTPYYFLARSKGRVIGAALVLRGHIGGVPLPIAQVERGPVCDSLAVLPAVLHALHTATLRHGIIRLSVMPYWSSDVDQVTAGLVLAGFADRQTFATRHARSLRLNVLETAEADLFATPDHAKLRRDMRKALKAGAVARRGTPADMAAFRGLYETQMRQTGKALPSGIWYQALAAYFFDPKSGGAMFVCEAGGKIVSAILISAQAGLATFVWGASSPEETGFLKMVLPMAEAVLWAKRTQCHTFDLGGIPLEGDPDVKRAGIAKFKYGFSHTEISLVHEHVRWF
jgi:Uncharacterized protein involved in methicillin resistance